MTCPKFPSLLLWLTLSLVLEELDAILKNENLQSTPEQTSIGKIASACRSRFDKLHRREPDNRQDQFCEKVAKRAAAITADALDDHAFRIAFNDPLEIRDSLKNTTIRSMGALHRAVSRLNKELERFRREDNSDPLFCLVIDEIGALMEKKQIPKFVALHRMISVISNGAPFWYLFLSTKSNLDVLLPSDHAVQSGASKGSLREGQQSLFPPFTLFGVDIPDLENKLKFQPSSDLFKKFSDLDHLARFGRPLWAAYPEPANIAERKLLGGQPQEIYFNASNRDEVFAVLAARLCLDTDLSNPETLPLSQTAVNLHLRILTSLDPATGVLLTRTAAEPIVSYAAMRQLRKKSNWKEALECFAKDLLSKGVIAKGSKGELYARVMLTLAHDVAVRSMEPPRLPTFTVGVFLESLFDEAHHDVLRGIDQSILDGWLNFIMFTKTKEPLDPDLFDETCHSLLRRAAALQLAPYQRTYDLFIPFYGGDHDKPYDAAKAGAILVQVKNKSATSPPEQILGETFFRGRHGHRYQTRQSGARPNKDRIIFHGISNKLLFIVLDLDAEKAEHEEEKLIVSCSGADNPRIWAIWSKGHDENTFGCIRRMSVKGPVDRFFAKVTENEMDHPIGVRHDADILENLSKHDTYEWGTSAEGERGSDCQGEPDRKKQRRHSTAVVVSAPSEVRFAS